MQTQIIEVQTVRHGIAGKISVVQNDSARILKCVLTDYVIPTVAIARIYARKPSGAVVYNDCAIANNTVEVKLTNQMLAETGIICCQIEITEAGKTLTSFEFQLDVKRQLKDNSVIESSDEFSALEDALNKLNNYLPVTGGTVDGDTEFKNNKIEILTLTRKDSANGAAIKYQNNAKVLGYLGFDGSGNLAAWESDSPTASGMRAILLANKQNIGSLSITTTMSGGTALTIDNTNSTDDKTYIAFKNKGQTSGYLSMLGNDLYTYKNSSNCKVLDSKNYSSVITDYMQVFDVKSSIKLKVPVAKTTDSESYFAAKLNYVIKAENINAVAFVNKQISTSASNISYRTGSISNISSEISNVSGENYVYITLTNKSTASNMSVEFSNSSGISVVSVS